jgi:hypothetical protein
LSWSGELAKLGEVAAVGIELTGRCPDRGARRGQAADGDLAASTRSGIAGRNGVAIALLIDRLAVTKDAFVDLGKRFNASITIRIATREGHIGFGIRPELGMCVASHELLRVLLDLDARLEVGVRQLPEATPADVGPIA